MRRILPVLACFFCLTPAMRSEEYYLPDGSPLSGNGGLIIIHRQGQTTVSLGGALFPRMVKTTTAGPEGPVVTRFTLPSVFHVPVAPPLEAWAPALVRVEIPDADGLLYIEGRLVRRWGTVRQLQSPPLPPGKAYPLHVRAAFKVGDHFLIEDREVLLRTGESAAVTFDGRRAVSVRLPSQPSDLASSPGKPE